MRGGAGLNCRSAGRNSARERFQSDPRESNRTHHLAWIEYVDRYCQLHLNTLSAYIDLPFIAQFRYSETDSVPWLVSSCKFVWPYTVGCRHMIFALIIIHGIFCPGCTILVLKHVIFRPMIWKMHAIKSVKTNLIVAPNFSHPWSEVWSMTFDGGQLYSIFTLQWRNTLCYMDTHRWNNYS